MSLITRRKIADDRDRGMRPERGLNRRTIVEDHQLAPESSPGKSCRDAKDAARTNDCNPASAVFDVTTDNGETEMAQVPFRALLRKLPIEQEDNRWGQMESSANATEPTVQNNIEG
ncbi:transposase [Anopheles sinensis]|uniref:Transposase n=1 Tax=Anopheles sinensis TaxID=74873 RepID=A0A084VT12_ANOSI|nr:transposase [Anopheles sinensis]